MLNKIKEFVQSAQYHKSLKFIFVIAIIAAIPLTVLIALKQQDIRQRAGGGGLTQPFPPSNIALRFSPDTGIYKVGDELNAQILVESGSEKITGVNFTLYYNSTIFEMKSFTPSSESAFLNTLVNKINPVYQSGLGTVNYAAVNTQGPQNQYNYFSLGKLNFKAKNTGTGGVIGFLDAQITALGQPNALSYSNTPLTYTIVNELTPTPTFIITSPTTSVTTPTPTQTITPTPIKLIGDINNNNEVDILDYNIWRDEFRGVYTTKQSDLNKDGKVDLLDFNIWRNAYNPISPTPTNPTPTSIPPLSLTGQGAFDLSISGYSLPIEGLISVDQKNRKINLTCKLGVQNCSFTAFYRAKNRTDKVLYYPTIWVENNGQPNMLRYVNFNGQLTSNKSMITVNRMFEPGQEAINTYFSITPPKATGSYLSNIYIDAKTCNSAVNPPDCIYYGGSSFAVMVYVNP